MTQTYVSGQEVFLATKLTPAGTVNLISDPGIDSGRIYFKNDFQEEWIDFTGVSLSGGFYVLSGVTRDIDPLTIPMTSLSTGKTWLATQIGVIVAMHDQIIDINQPTQLHQEALTFATTTARDTALGGNGVCTFNYTDVKCTDTGLFYNYNTSSNQWEVQGTGTATPNASTTVSGSVEIATTAESKAGTDTGGTGALLSVLPSDIAKNTQSGTFVYGTDSGGDDTYVVALTPTLTAYTTGQRLTFTPTTANTGACSVDFGPGVINIKTKDGNDPQSSVIRANQPVTGTYNGTNFILDSEDFATTSNKGIVEMATDGEATTGTDQERYINPKQAKDNYLLLAKGVNFNRDLTTASGTTTVTHSLGKTPKMITINGYYATGTSRCTSLGVYDGDTTTTYVGNSSGDGGQDTTNLIVIRPNSTTDNQVATISNITTSSFDLVWVKTGSPTGTAYFTATIIA